MRLKPLTPFEPIVTDHIRDRERWIGQVKWDGVRLLTYYDGRELRLFNRKKNERTNHYPELSSIRSYCQASSVILDGEIIALGTDGKPSFQRVMRRDGIRRMARVRRARKMVPITYMVFDVIYYNGEWITERKLSDRLEILTHTISPNDHVQLVRSHSEIVSLAEVVRQQQLEGIVMKDLNSAYLINGKDQRWQKKKNYQALTAVIGGVTFRRGLVNAILLGLYDDEGKLWYIGHAGAGRLTRSDWKRLTERIKPLIISRRPFVNRPERMQEAIWVEPEFAVGVQYLEWTEKHSLRQPSIQTLVDVPVEQCVFNKFK